MVSAPPSSSYTRSLHDALPISLKGPLHGGANEQVMAMLLEIGEEENAIPYIKTKLDNKELIMGMGHRVYRSGDPRAKHLQKMSKELTKLRRSEERRVGKERRKRECRETNI